MTTIELNKAPELKRLVKAALPSYIKHNAFLSVFSAEHGLNINSYWDGGSRDTFVALDLTTMRTKALPTSSHPYFDVAAKGIEGDNNMVAVDSRGNITLKQLPVNVAIIKAGTFCGKQATAHIYLNPENMPNLLNA